MNLIICCTPLQVLIAKEIILSNEQISVARYPENGVIRVNGGPGSGKTLVAVKRAIFLAKDYKYAEKDDKVLFLENNNKEINTISLDEYLENHLKKIDENHYNVMKELSESKKEKESAPLAASPVAVIKDDVPHQIYPHCSGFFQVQTVLVQSSVLEAYPVLPRFSPRS